MERGCWRVLASKARGAIDHARSGVRRWRAPAGRTFRADERGTTAAIFGLVLVPMVLSVGGGADYAVAVNARSILNGVADGAALAAVAQSEMIRSPGDAKKAAKNFFDAHKEAVKGAKVTSVSINVNDGTSARTATISYTAEVATTFLSIIGMSKLTVTGTAVASSDIAPYIDFYMLLDNTPSMGLGATTTDINTLVNKTSDKCAFACHQLDAVPNDYYSLAKKLGVTMRIDVVRTATQRTVDTAAATKTRDSQFRFAVYTFGTSADKIELTEVAGLSPKLDEVKSQSSAVDLMKVPYQNYRGDTLTNYDAIFKKLNEVVPAPGDGTDKSKPQKFVFFVSDGVNDANKTSCSKKLTTSQDPLTRINYSRCQEPLNVALCTALKDRGVKIAVLYTTYQPLPTNGWYNTWIKPFTSEIATNMKACASPDLFFEVSPTQGIEEAMLALFKKSLQQARLVK